MVGPPRERRLHHSVREEAPDPTPRPQTSRQYATAFIPAGLWHFVVPAQGHQHESPKNKGRRLVLLGSDCPLGFSPRCDLGGTCRPSAWSRHPQSCMAPEPSLTALGQNRRYAVTSHDPYCPRPEVTP